MLWRNTELMPISIQKYRAIRIAGTSISILPISADKLVCRAQGRIKAGADGAAAPGPQSKIGPPLF